MVSASQVENAFRDVGIVDRPVEIHVSLRSFGRLANGPATIVEGVLATGSTLLAATMASDQYGIPAPPHDRPPRNGIDYSTIPSTDTAPPSPYPNLHDHTSTVVSTWLGGFSAHVAARPDRIRCRLASGEFCAVGPLAARLIGAETDADVFGPLRELCAENGAVVLMGVGLTRMTLLHLAEVEAGRHSFIRWVRSQDGRVLRVRAGECSEGFESLAEALIPVDRQFTVGESNWRVFPAAEAVDLAAEAMRTDPPITHCPDPDCIECADAIAGGPLE